MRLGRAVWPLLAALGLLFGVDRARAEPRPLWELGAGGAVLTAPDYIGSDEYRVLGSPFPYFVYHGRRVRIDREALRGRLFSHERVEVEVSLNGTIPVRSKHNDAREGMPDLDFSGEIGPRLRWILHRSEDRSRNVFLDLPVRAVFVSDFTYLDHAGWTSSPAFRYTGQHFGWTLDAIAGLEFADSSYHDYFYGVDERYATPERPAYSADAGFGGTRLALGFNRRFGRLFTGVFTRYMNLTGATFEDSPLVRSTNSVVAGLAVAWVFHESSTMVDEEGTPIELEGETGATDEGERDAASEAAEDQ